ncbi:MAG: DUF126 domain-containing protein [Staphylothermus sp.]|nr:DUF126 domain-containing protein [Staphylothermus sp.]
MKIIVDGDCEAQPFLIDRYISFFGEVDPVKGIVKPENTYIGDKAVIFRGSRGSTVGSYIIYALKYYGHKPSCFIVKEAEPILIAGCVLADIPLFVVENYDYLTQIVSSIKSGVIKHDGGGKYIEIEEIWWLLSCIRRPRWCW